MFRTLIKVQEKVLIKGKIEYTGTSKAGNPYRIGTYRVTVYDESNEVDVLMKAFNDLNDKLIIGSFFDIGFKLESNTWEGKLYTSFSIITATPKVMNEPSQQSAPPAAEPEPTTPYATDFVPGGLSDDKDDLPF